MTREEQRTKAAHEYIQSDSVAAGNEILAFGDFIEGAKWADSHLNWIAVNDKLPKRNNTDRFSEIVIAWTIDGQIDTTYYDFEKNEWGWMSNVTHWMTLPQPPIKEDKK